MSLYDLTNDFTELFDQFEQIESYEPDKDENGAYIDENGEIIENPKAFIESRKTELCEAWFDTLDGIEELFEDKAVNIALFIKELESEAAQIKAEKLRLQARQSKKEKTAAKLREYLMNSMNRIKREKIDSPKAYIRVKLNPESTIIDNEDSVILWAQNNNRDEDVLSYQKPKILLNEVKKLIRNGEDISGARLYRAPNIEIK